jgi:hypothetical protein
MDPTGHPLVLSLLKRLDDNEPSLVGTSRVRLANRFLFLFLKTVSITKIENYFLFFFVRKAFGKLFS